MSEESDDVDVGSTSIASGADELISLLLQLMPLP